MAASCVLGCKLANEIDDLRDISRIAWQVMLARVPYELAPCLLVEPHEPQAHVRRYPILLAKDVQRWDFERLVRLEIRHQLVVGYRSIPVEA